MERADATNKALQNPKMGINSAVASIQSLTKFVESKLECFHEYEQNGEDLAGTSEYKISHQKVQNVRLKPLDYGNAPPVQLQPSDKFRVENFIPVIDNYLCALKRRLFCL